jgi:hypothetical protein
MLYRLSNCSSPGFELYTECLEYILHELELRVCDTCKVKDDVTLSGLPIYYKSLPTKDKINELLSTDCGVEFYLDVVTNEQKFYKVVEEHIDFEVF